MQPYRRKISRELNLRKVEGHQKLTENSFWYQDAPCCPGVTSTAEAAEELGLVDHLDTELDCPVVLRTGVLTGHHEVRALGHARSHPSPGFLGGLGGLLAAHRLEPAGQHDGLPGKTPGLPLLLRRLGPTHPGPPHLVAELPVPRVVEPRVDRLSNDRTDLLDGLQVRDRGPPERIDRPERVG